MIKNFLLVGFVLLVGACEQHNTYVCYRDVICDEDVYRLISTRELVTGTVILPLADMRMVMEVKNGKEISGKIYTSMYGVINEWKYVNGQKIEIRY